MSGDEPARRPARAELRWAASRGPGTCVSWEKEQRVAAQPGTEPANGRF